MEANLLISRDALSRATTLPPQSSRASSPPLSIRSGPSARSEITSLSASSEGSRSTTFQPPMSDIQTIRSPSVTRSPSISSESFTGSGSSSSNGTPRKFRTSTLASASIFGPARSETESVRSPQTLTGTELSRAPSSASTDTRSSRTSDTRSGTTETRSRTTGTFLSPPQAGFSFPFLTPAYTGTGRSYDDSALSSAAESFASEGRVITASRSSSLRRTTSMTDLETEVREPPSPR